MTLLFTDIEGSTQLLKHLGDAYGDTLEQHRQLVRSAVEDHGGTEIGTEGDSFFVVFPTASAGMSGALAAQRALTRHRWPTDAVVRVRMGLHTGSVARSGSQYIGMVVHEAARIAATAHGGQIVISEATADAGDTPLDATLRSLGAYRLKDIEDEMRILQLCHDELRDEFPALRSGPPPAAALPSFASSFVGRAAELAELDALVRVCRLLTIVGPPGVGKTRLGIELGRALMTGPRSGVRFVELGTVESGVADHVLRALGATTQSDQPAANAVVNYLASSDTVLIIDNCEHVLGEVAELVHEIMSGCALVRVVLTSREPLDVVGETTWLLLPLHEAAQLFVERARAVAPTTTLRVDDPDVLAISSELDGLPLAIELAAAQTRRKSVSDIARELADPLSFLDRSSRTVNDRHATLRAAIDWSYRLLAPSEATLLDRLAVCAGSFDEHAADALAGTHTEGDLERLVDQSLVSVDWNSGHRRYQLLATIRAYAAAQLAAAHQRASAEEAHARHFRGARARVSDGEWRNSLSGLEERANDLANHRTALGWYYTHDPTDGLAYATDLDVLWYLRLAPREGIETIERFLAVADRADDATRGSALAILADLYRRRGQFDDARRCAEAAIAFDVRAGHDRGMVSARIVLAQILAMQGEAELAGKVFEDNLEHARVEGDEREMLMSRRGLISLALERGDADAARALLTEAQEQAGRLDLLFMSGVLMGDRAWLAMLDGDIEDARTRMQEILVLTQWSGNANGIAEMSLRSARVARHAGAFDEAIELLEQAIRIYSTEGDDGGIAHVLTERAVIASLRGDHARAGFLLSGASAIRERLGIATPGSETRDVENARRAAASVLSQDQIAAAWDAGRESNLESLLEVVRAGD